MASDAIEKIRTQTVLQGNDRRVFDEIIEKHKIGRVKKSANFWTEAEQNKYLDINDPPHFKEFIRNYDFQDEILSLLKGVDSLLDDPRPKTAPDIPGIGETGTSFYYVLIIGIMVMVIIATSIWYVLWGFDTTTSFDIPW